MKIFTSLLIVTLMATVTAASAQRGYVILNSNTNYEVEMDDRGYQNQGRTTITDLAPGNHTIAVFQVVSKGIFGIGRKRNQISFEQFQLGNNNLNIAVSQAGQIRISGYHNNNSGHQGQNKNDEYDRNKDREHRNDENREGKGNGHKYGHYKNNKNKHHHDDDDSNENRQDRSDHD